MRKPKKDEKMLAMNLRFFATGISVTEKGKKLKTIVETGMLYPVENKTLGVAGMKPQPFACFEDIVPLIKEILRKNHFAVVSKCRRPRIYNHKRRAY